MRITEFIEKVINLGYECEVTQSKIEVYRIFGKDLRNKTKIATIHLIASNHFSMSLDPTSASDGIGEIITEFGMSSLRQRGRLTKYSYRDGSAMSSLI